MEPQKARDTEFDLVRYPMLVQLWYHHNQMLLQWPGVIVGTTILFLAYIIISKVTKILDLATWGQDGELIFVVGIPMILIGIGLLIFLYLMRRAQLIMKIIEDQLNKIEQEKVEITFRDINHPPGHSAVKFIWSFMLMCLALPMLIFGILFSLGMVPSAIGFFVVLLIVGTIKIVKYDSSNSDGSRALFPGMWDKQLSSVTLSNTKIWLVQSVSLSRIFAVILFAWLSYWNASQTLIVCLYAFAMISDLIDGYLAQKLKAETHFGMVTDIIADKSLTIVSLLYAAANGINILPLALIAIRDIISIGMRLINVEGSQLLPTNRFLGGIMALLLWGNTLVLMYARTGGELVRVTNIIYWICAIILVVNLIVRVYMSALRIKIASTNNQ